MLTRNAKKRSRTCGLQNVEFVPYYRAKNSEDRLFYTKKPKGNCELAFGAVITCPSATEPVSARVSDERTLALRESRQLLALTKCQGCEFFGKSVAEVDRIIADRAEARAERLTAEARELKAQALVTEARNELDEVLKPSSVMCRKCENPPPNQEFGGFSYLRHG